MPRLRPIPDKKEEKRAIESINEIVQKAVTEKEPEQEIVISDKPVEIELSDEPVAEPVVVKTDDATEALKKQIENLKKSEELQRQYNTQLAKDRDDAIARNREQQAQLARYQKETQESQSDAILSAMAAAKSEADKATSDIEAAANLGDAKAQAEAYRRLARAEARLDKLEDGKAALEANAKEVPTQQPGQQNDLPQSANDYLALHPEIMADPKINRRVEYLHKEAIASGHPAFSPSYYRFLDVELGYVKEEPKVEVEDDPPTPREKSKIVTAPVSREVPDAGGKRSPGKVTLTRAEQEAAKSSGISLEEYARQKQRLAEMRANGEYGDRYGEQR